MIQLFADKCQKPIAWSLFVIFYMQLISPLYALNKYSGNFLRSIVFDKNKNSDFKENHIEKLFNSNVKFTPKINTSVKIPAAEKKIVEIQKKVTSIGGPSSPEATSFKAVGSDNLVNLFTGDFSYSIPLLDVGGYPVNLFYSGGISMEQEASWVGLGWNINPGTVNRNMRGVPDDFNGTDTLIQRQNLKPNRTWGGEVGFDAEVLGIKKPQIGLGLSLGISYNNYLGPALDLGTRVSMTIPIMENIKGEKAAPYGDSSTGSGISLNLGSKLSSRSGLTISPSLTANFQTNNKKMDLGIGLNTSYNSRTGIKDINITSQTTLYKYQKTDNGKPNTQRAPIDMASNSFSFARPSYMPTLRMPMENANYSGQLEIGGVGMFGLKGTLHGTGYYSESKVPVESRVLNKSLVGFLYSENANGDPNAVMDFTRVNDGEVTPNTPIISAPQYAYDIFSIQGEGTGGSIRAYRGDLGFMRDNVTTSKDKNFTLGFDIAPAGHYGGNWNIISAPTRVGGWEDGNNTLLNTMTFKQKKDNSSFENVYFKNPGESTVTNDEILKRIGGDNLVRFKLEGSNVTPRLSSILEKFNKKTGTPKGYDTLKNINNLQHRDKRTQVITMLTADDASKIGLERQIRNYTGTFDTANNIQYDTIPRVGSFRKKHHISEIDVLEQGGMRYIYGLPVYNIIQKDFTFSVTNVPTVASDNLVNFTSTEPTTNSEHMANSSKLAGYVQSQETPAYASSFLITGLLSPDYVDVTGDGITEDDLGGAVKFNYTKSDSLHKWRTPRKNGSGNEKIANLMKGLNQKKKIIKQQSSMVKENPGT